jgi:hypothetical protein
MFNLPGTILQAISDTLQQYGIQYLPGQWSNIANQSQVRAYNDIVSALAARGYTGTQIQGWDRGPEVELDQSIFYALERAGTLAASLDDKFLKTFDRREDLKTIAYTEAGQYVDPTGTAGQCGSDYVSTSGDVFVWPPRDGSTDFPGPGLGEVTRY